MTQPPSSDQPASSGPVVSGEQPSLGALREAVLQAAATLLRVAEGDAAPPARGRPRGHHAGAPAAR